MTKELLDEVKKRIEDLAKEYPSVIGVFLFGSLARGKIAKTSPFWDIDLAFVLDPFVEDVANNIELSFPEKYDIVILNRAPLNILVEVAKTGKLIFVKDKHRLNVVMNKLLADVRRMKSFLERRGVKLET